MSTSVVQVLSYEGRAECDGCEHYVLRTVSEGAVLDGAMHPDDVAALRQWQEARACDGRHDC